MHKYSQEELIKIVTDSFEAERNDDVNDWRVKQHTTGTNLWVKI